MKTFIISLKRSTARRAHIVAEAKRRNLDYEIFDAVDGNALSGEEIQSLCDFDNLRTNAINPTRAMIGCALSHYRVYQRIIDEGLPMALIIEDDILLPRNLNEILCSIEKVVQKNEIISLFQLSYDWRRFSTQGAIDIPGGLSLMYPINLQRFTSAVAYVITNDACATLSKVIAPIRMPADYWFNFFAEGGFKSFRCVFPNPIKLTFFGSTQDYNGSGSVSSKIAGLVDKYRVPLISQALKYRRQRECAKMQKFEILDKEPEVQFSQD